MIWRNSFLEIDAMESPPDGFHAIEEGISLCFRPVSSQRFSIDQGKRVGRGLPDIQALSITECIDEGRYEHGIQDRASVYCGRSSDLGSVEAQALSYVAHALKPRTPVGAD